MPLPRILTLIAAVLTAGAVTVAVAALATPALGAGAGVTSIALLATALALLIWRR